MLYLPSLTLTETGLLFSVLEYAGTWQTGGVFQADDWIKIARDIPLNLAATLLVNPCTAYRMLKDFVPLYEGNFKAHYISKLFHTSRAFGDGYTCTVYHHNLLGQVCLMCLE